MLTKIPLIAVALIMTVGAAAADHKQINQNWNGGGNWDGHNFNNGDRPPPPGPYPHKRKHKNHNNNKYFYQDPNFWGGVAGGLIGGAIINQYDYDNVPPPYPEYQVQPECQNVWISFYIPGYGYQRQRTLICNQ